MLELTRHIGLENARMKAGAPLQTTIGPDLGGMTLGIFGLGKLGQRSAAVAKAFGMKAIAWSPNLTPERATAGGADYVSKEDLFAKADFITIHMVLSDRSRGLITAADIGRMKRSAYLINTSRGPIVEEKALIAALQSGKIAGAGLDVFDHEPLPLDHPYRKMDNVVITPHIGYVSTQNYAQVFPRHRGRHPRVARRQAGQGDRGEVAYRQLRWLSWPGLPGTSLRDACLSKRGHRDKPGDDKSG